ncbi:SpoIIE family protein phosphatase [Streptomyces sp. PSKA54]|uniref:SpoIIE family protein phosphatase n=1 Tax=Streptomyces himalayensis subsp. aureolus TaxID=2758039 RepID=A0A7W2D3C4_9ACTN|nr:SpoIIE family protein phosphatase [Streptomyces himalayensis]MBA4863874.1 SpoIIE family protein phosphatase [Streptomyces himalayensis subsp. aureolus]
MTGSETAGRDDRAAWHEDLVDETATARATVDPQGRVTGWSEGARRLLGYESSEVVGRSAALLLADDPPAELPRSLAGLRRWSGTATLRHRDGHRLEVGLLAHRRIRNQSQDQRQNQRQNQRQDQSQDRNQNRQQDRNQPPEQHSLDSEWLLVSPLTSPTGPSRSPGGDALVMWGFAQSACLMALYDTGLRLRRANADMERAIGLSEDAMRGLRLPEILADPQGDLTEERMRRALETGERQHLQIAVRLPFHDRASIWTTSLAPVRDAGGEIQGVLLSAHDTTEQHLARQRLALLNDASVRIGSTLDLTRTAQELADVAVPSLADFVTVDLLPAVEGSQNPLTGPPSSPVMLRRVACQSVLEGSPEATIEPGAVTTYPDRSPPAECLAVGRPLIREVTADAIAEWESGHPDRAERVRRYGFHSVLAVPMEARGITLGVATFSRHRRPEPFETDDLPLAEEITARAAMCIDNARRYTTERSTSLILQSSLLPQRPPRQAAVDVASRYLPASGQTGVGGDWFDVIPLSGARVALVVGDVVGHGIQASATMGRLRTAVRTLADVDLPPDELLTHLDDLVNRVSAEGDDSGSASDMGAIGATCLYAVYDPVSRCCALARAAHPVPALATPDGRVEFLDVPAGPPLGLGGLPFECLEREIPEGSLLALYTDGLIEVRGRDVDEGIAALQDVLAHPAASLEGTCDAVLHTLLPGRPVDDVALLLARTRALGANQVATWDVPPDPAAVAETRRRACRQLADWGLDEAVFVTELVVSELVTNAIRYAAPPIRLRLIHDRSLICEVSDASTTSPHLRRARTYDEGGRGLLLVAQLTQAWGTRQTHHGKTIWAEQALPVAV